MPFIAAILGIFLLAGCSRDPRVLKRRYFSKGTAYFAKGQYAEAAIEYQNAIQVDPKFSQAHYRLAQCYAEQAYWGGAYQEFSRTVEIAPGNLNAQIDLSHILLAAGKFPDARDHAEVVLKSEPQNAEAQILVADADAGSGDLSKAITEAQMAIQMDANRSASYLSLALLQERNQDAPAAEHSFQKALALDPKSTNATLALGRFYQSQKRWQDAEKQFQAAIALDPLNPSPRAALANLYLGEGQKDMAEQVLRDAKAALKDNPVGYRMLGDFYLSQQESDKAAAEFSALHAEHPKDTAVTKTYVQILILRNNLDQATKLNDSILQASPSDSDSLVLRGQILTREGKPSDAVSTLASAAKASPDNPLAHYFLGVAYADTSNFSQAQTEWLQAAQLRPGMADPERALAALALRNGNTDLLADSSSQLIKIEPHSPEGYIFHAKASFAKGDQAATEADLKMAMSLAPQDADPFTLMGDLRIVQKNPDEAAKFYAQALALNPSASGALTGLINIDLGRKMPAQALSLVQDQITRAPGNSYLYVLLGQVEAANQDPAKAEAAFQKAIDLDKNNVPAVLLLANVLVSRGSLDEAISSYQRALVANPGDIRIYIAMAGLFEKRDQWQSAEDMYKKALQIQPNNPLAANNLAYLMLDHGGDVNVALSLAQTGRRGLPNLPASADTLGWAYYHQGAYDSAIDALQQAVNGDPKNATYHYHLGMSYEKVSNFAQAKKQLEWTLQLSPDFSQAAEIRGLLSGQPQHD
jgi:tetratricopeptide (TPR) repeat protein